jgi:RNA polymerase sigma factor (sigma-70 family)
MGVRKDLFAPCYAMVAMLNQRHRWSLTDAQIDHYTNQILQSVPAAYLDTQLDQAVLYFHANHTLVAALSDEHNPDHTSAWAWVAQEITRLIKHKELDWANDRAVEVGDLVQIVQAEVVRSLGKYQYISNLRTWLYSVTLKRLTRHNRDSLASKRAGRPASIEQAGLQAVDWGDLERDIMANALVEHIFTVLNHTGDERYARIFQLQIIDGRSGKEVSASVQLHESRVRALLKVARQLLQKDPGLRSWLHNEIINEISDDTRLIE